MATKRSSVFRLDVKSSGPVRQQLLDFVVPIIERISGLAGLRRLYERAPAGGTPDDLLGAVLEDLEVDVTVDEPGLRGIPVTGPVVVVANHPFGAVEGMMPEPGVWAELLPSQAMPATPLRIYRQQLRKLQDRIDAAEQAAAEQAAQAEQAEPQPQEPPPAAAPE